MFRPNDVISRAEAAKILSRIVQKTHTPETVQGLSTTSNLQVDSIFADVDESDTLSLAVNDAYNACLLH